MLTVIFLGVFAVSSVVAGSSECQVPAQTQAGVVCGVKKGKYASFLGVPYAKQPTGERRFKELEPLDHWKGFFNASSVSPICPQHDVFYGPMMTTHNMSESCIHANIHVPFKDLPEVKFGGSRRMQSPLSTGREQSNEVDHNATGLPILVFIHGGGFAFGSGNNDVYGPEYLMKKHVIVITFNYRLGPFGFLSLNSSSIPGNAGLRDMITLLRWVQENARGFGGNPDDVTIAGQSAGSAAVHLLTLSKAAQGLFKKAIMMSGNAVRSFHTTSPLYAKSVSNDFLKQLNINATDPEVIHQILVQMPLEQIMEANRVLQDQRGLVLFFPVVESTHHGVLQVIDNDPEQLIMEGRGSNIPLMIGFTNAECETFVPVFNKLHMALRVASFPVYMMPLQKAFQTPLNLYNTIQNVMMKRYFDGPPTVEGYTKFCTESSFVYPAIYSARRRTEVGGAPVFLYQFSYEGEHRVLEKVYGSLTGAGHMEDLVYLFKVNSVPNAYSQKDESIRRTVTTFFTNFIKTGNPSRDYIWPPLQKGEIKYLDINRNRFLSYTSPTEEQEQMVNFYDNLYR